MTTYTRQADNLDTSILDTPQLPFWGTVFRLLLPALVMLLLCKPLLLVGVPMGAWFSLFFLLMLYKSARFFVQALMQPVQTWRHFRIWVTFQLLLFFVVWVGLIFVAPLLFAPPPPEPGQIRCGTGAVIVLLIGVPMFAMGYLLWGWITFGAIKTTVSFFKPHYYQKDYVWGGSDPLDCGTGSLALAPLTQEGGLTLDPTREEGQLSLSPQK